MAIRLRSPQRFFPVENDSQSLQTPRSAKITAELEQTHTKLVYLLHTMPNTKLDTQWLTAINTLIERGLTFGNHLALTFKMQKTHDLILKIKHKSGRSKTALPTSGRPNTTTEISSIALGTRISMRGQNRKHIFVASR